MAVATKEKFEVSQLTEKQQELMIAARNIQQRGGGLVMPNELAMEIEGNTGAPAISKMTLGVAALRKKGCWLWNEKGKLIPAGETRYSLVWPDGTTGAAAGTGPSAGRSTRTPAGREATKQAEIEFVHAIQAAYKELPFESQTRVKEYIRSLEDIVMEA